MIDADYPWVRPFLFFVAIIFVAIIYFIPAIVAYSRKHHNATAILILNLFLGWTAIGWIMALVWAATAVRKDVKAHK